MFPALSEGRVCGVLTSVPSAGGREKAPPHQGKLLSLFAGCLANMRTGFFMFYTELNFINPACQQHGF